MRQAVALGASAAVAALAALIVGEYDLSLGSAIAAGVLAGLAIAETARAIDPRAPRSRWWVLAALGAGSLLWAGWIAVHHRDEGLPSWAWAGAVAAAGAVTVRSRAGAARSGGSGSPFEP